MGFDSTSNVLKASRCPPVYMTIRNIVIEVPKSCSHTCNVNTNAFLISFECEVLSSKVIPKYLLRDDCSQLVAGMTAYSFIVFYFILLLAYCGYTEGTL
jgi:hypothetical protein